MNSRFPLYAQRRADTRNIPNATACVALVRGARVRIACGGDVATLATLLARDRARFRSTLRLISERASRILGIRTRRVRITRGTKGLILLRS